MALNDLLREEMKSTFTWVPISKELPPDGEQVLLKVEGTRYEVGYYDKESDKIVCNPYYTCNRVLLEKSNFTHWAKINFPKP